MGALDLVLGALVGLALGLLGGGGSVLTVPILVYVSGLGAGEAVASGLVVVGGASFLGALGHWREGNLEWRMAAVLAPSAVTGAYAGARLAVFLGEAAQLSLFAVVVLLAAFSMLREGEPEGEERDDVGASRGVLAGAIPVASVARILAGGAAAGVVTGLVGVGGGFLVLPVLVLLGNLPMKRAVGTSLPIIAANSAAGFAGYAGRVEVPWAFLSAFTAASLVGVLAGTYAARFVPQERLKRYFAVSLIAIGLFVLGENLSGAFQPK